MNNHNEEILSTLKQIKNEIPYSDGTTLGDLNSKLGEILSVLNKISTTLDILTGVDRYKNGILEAISDQITTIIDK
jgi:hypothetical protein